MVQVGFEQKQQACYFHIENNNKLFNVFHSKRIRNRKLFEDTIHFQIERVKSKSKNNKRNV